jgi:hypothetical protein
MIGKVAAAASVSSFGCYYGGQLCGLDDWVGFNDANVNDPPPITLALVNPQIVHAHYSVGFGLRCNGFGCRERQDIASCQQCLAIRPMKGVGEASDFPGRGQVNALTIRVQENHFLFSCVMNRGFRKRQQISRADAGIVFENN